MANHAKTVRTLSVNISSTGEAKSREMTLVASFTEGIDTWEITLPTISHDELRQLVGQFMLAISTDPRAASLAGGDNFTVELVKP